MFFDDAAAGAQRKGRRFVLAFGSERRRRVRGWLRRRIVGRRIVQRGIVRREVNHDEVALAVRANEQDGGGVSIEAGVDLAGKVYADMEDLMGLGEDSRK